MHPTIERAVSAIRTLDPDLNFHVDEQVSFCLVRLPAALNADYRFTLCVNADGESEISASLIDGDPEAYFWRWPFEQSDYGNQSECEAAFILAVKDIATLPTRISQKRGVLRTEFQCEIRRSAGWSRIGPVLMGFRWGTNPPPITGKVACYQSSSVIPPKDLTTTYSPMPSGADAKTNVQQHDVHLTAEAAQMIRLLLETHGLEVAAAHQDWLVPSGQLPAIRPIWFDGTSTSCGVLDVEVLLDDQRLVIESFAGLGERSVALGDAIENFSINSLHVLLSSVWGRSQPDQVTIENWSISGVRRPVHIGVLGRRKSTGPNVPVPDELFSAIERAIRSESLSPAHHWFRTYTCHLPGRPLTFEALADNECWPAGEAALESILWPKNDQFYSVRSFIFIPAHPETKIEQREACLVEKGDFRL